MATDTTDLAVTRAPRAFAPQIEALRQDLKDKKTVPYNVLSPTGKQAAQALQEQGEARIGPDANDNGATIVKAMTFGPLQLLTSIITFGHR